jgi:hypothetical protein
MTKGIGVDIGTMNLVAARQEGDATSYSRIRDAFLDVPLTARNMLKLSSVDFVERDDELLILGDKAMEMAAVFGREARRPLSAGLVSPSELDSIEVLGFLLQHIVKAPQEEGEYCYFSVPAAPVDQPDKDVIYHKGIFEQILTKMGYNAVPTNEAMAIIFAECAPEGFSGLSFSFGSGMTNVALSINTIECMAFSVGRGGDWIDGGAARSIGSTQSRICSVKEKGFDLLNPIGREQEALSFYYKELISYSLDWVAREFVKVSGRFNLAEPIPIIVSGGTSKAGSFLPFFQEVFERKKKRFPIEISEIRAASDPLNAVAKGMLIQAMQEYV